MKMEAFVPAIPELTKSLGSGAIQLLQGFDWMASSKDAGPALPDADEE